MLTIKLEEFKTPRIAQYV